MHVQLKLVLDCPPDAAWSALRSPAVFGAVSFPLVEFTPLDGTRFPEQWDEGAHAVAARALFGTVPAGTQSIDLTFRRRGSWRIFEDHGGPLSGPLTLLTHWRHRMAVAVTADGRTLFRDRLEFSAPWPLRPLVWIGLWAFWQWRGARLARLAPEFATRFGSRSR